MAAGDGPHRPHAPLLREIGLLVASGRTEAGHRVYSDADVERLYRISLLRRLGLPMSENGATIRYKPVDQTHGYREYGALDLEGHLWSFMKPLD